MDELVEGGLSSACKGRNFRAGPLILWSARYLGKIEGLDFGPLKLPVANLLDFYEFWGP
jgi:hypothetical protein